MSLSKKRQFAVLDFANRFIRRHFPLRAFIAPDGVRSREEREHEEGGIVQGAKAPASNAPFRGGKGSLHEGGVRVPAIVNWPGKLKPRIVNEPLHMVDVMPTLLALADGKGSPDHPFDGKDMWKTLADGSIYKP